MEPLNAKIHLGFHSVTTKSQVYFQHNKIETNSILYMCL